jgi:proline iminopeptidase
MKNIDPNVSATGHLSVGGGHKIYYEDWGNPEGFPILHLHGGPGSGFSDSHKLIYDPSVHRVIFHDQRGSGQSLPFASIKDNTTQHLIADIEKIREFFGIEKMHVSGGSWGSTLAMLYGIAHPKRVGKLMMWGIYLLRQFEQDYIYQGGPKETFPEAWQRFISLVPQSKRKNSADVIKFYAGKILSKNKKEAQKYAAEWTMWELSTTTHIQAYVVQGRFDMCTPPVSALDLKAAYGKNLHLQITRAGHLRSEPENLAALRAIASAALV